MRYDSHNFSHTHIMYVYIYINIITDKCKSNPVQKKKLQAGSRLRAGSIDKETLKSAHNFGRGPWYTDSGTAIRQASSHESCNGANLVLPFCGRIWTTAFGWRLPCSLRTHGGFQAHSRVEVQTLRGLNQSQNEGQDRQGFATSLLASSSVGCLST